MTLSEFLKKYRESVHAATGSDLSVQGLSKLIDVKADTLDKWERRGNIPRDEKIRIKLKVFFGLDDIQNISDKQLKEAIERYPKGLGEIIDVKKAKEIKLGASSANIPASTSKSAITATPNDKDEEDSLTLPTDKIEEGTMKELLAIMRMHAQAAVIKAQADLHSETTKDRLSSILERMEKRLEGEEEMHVKETGH